jgi:Protein of unknown function (DUF3800)
MSKLLFLDESGSHNLTVIDPNYPVFVLGGVLLDRDYAEGELEYKLRAFKRDLFGNENLILHTADLTRNRNGFEAMKDKAFREQCYLKLNQLMRELEYRVIACVIKKDGHLSRYGVSALDPYMFSLEVLVERFAMEVGNHWHGGEIVAECRSLELDKELGLAWENLRVQGSRFVTATEIRNRIVGVTARPKLANVAGLQLADLVVTPIGRFVLGKPVHEDFRIVESKFRCDASGNYWGRGLVVLPKE